MDPFNPYTSHSPPPSTLQTCPTHLQTGSQCQQPARLVCPRPTLSKPLRSLLHTIAKVCIPHYSGLQTRHTRLHILRAWRLPTGHMEQQATQSAPPPLVTTHQEPARWRAAAA